MPKLGGNPMLFGSRIDKKTVAQPDAEIPFGAEKELKDEEEA